MPKIWGNFLDFEGKLCYLAFIRGIEHPKVDHRELGPGKRGENPCLTETSKVAAKSPFFGWGRNDRRNESRNKKGNQGPVGAFYSPPGVPVARSGPGLERQPGLRTGERLSGGGQVLEPAGEAGGAGQPGINGDGLQPRDFTYVGNVAAANLLALAHPKAGPCNIGTSRETYILTIYLLLPKTDRLPLGTGSCPCQTRGTAPQCPELGSGPGITGLTAPAPAWKKAWPGRWPRLGSDS